MNVQIQSVKFDADKRLVDFIQAKMDKMDRFVERAIGLRLRCVSTRTTSRATRWLSSRST